MSFTLYLTRAFCKLCPDPNPGAIFFFFPKQGDFFPLKIQVTTLKLAHQPPIYRPLQLCSKSGLLHWRSRPVVTSLHLHTGEWGRAHPFCPCPPSAVSCVSPLSPPSGPLGELSFRRRSLMNSKHSFWILNVFFIYEREGRREMTIPGQWSFPKSQLFPCVPTVWAQHCVLS